MLPNGQDLLRMLAWLSSKVYHFEVFLALADAQDFSGYKAINRDLVVERLLVRSGNAAHNREASLLLI